ncbi:hypothetical protein [Nonlabens sp.]|uniref:hypothetical protein n=1 Tax=Nonlabens sp. TaxID=1888209 RepID=UPI003F6A5069
MKYIELRLRRDFGGVITAYLDFLKVNIKSMFNAFVNYNAVLFILVFIASFFLSSGFSSVMRMQTAMLSGGPTGEIIDSVVMYMIGAFILLLVYMAMFVINSGLSGGFIKTYEMNKTHNPDRREAVAILKKRAGGLTLITIIAAVLFMLVAAISLLIVIIPILGILIYMFIILMYITWIGMSMFAYTYNENYSIGKALGEGWDIMFSNFWKAAGVSFVIGLILYVVFTALQWIPNVINFYNTFNSIEAAGGINDSMAMQIFFFIFTSISTVLSIFSFFLYQTALGVLYIDLHEHKYNRYLRTRIESIGQRS